MESKVYELIKKYALVLCFQEYDTGKVSKLMVSVPSGCYKTADGAALSCLKETDIIHASGNTPEEKLLAEDNEINAIVIAQTPYAMICEERNIKIKAVLDDMAQIVGPTAKTVNYDYASLKKALKQSTGCFVAGKYIISTGRSLFEAVTAMTVLEKSAEVYLKAQVLGGGKPINSIEAGLMRLIYKKKYSKAEDKFKEEEESKL